MYKAMIMYSSLTGNTEKVAMTFKEAILQYEGWECDTYKIDKKTDFTKDPLYLDDYDFIALGSPVIAALPTDFITYNFGANHPEPIFLSRPRDGCPFPHLDGTRIGVVFTTYCGSVNMGPAECTATLELMSNYLEARNIAVVGKFGCAGKEIRHMAVDQVARSVKIEVGEAADVLARYLSNPNAEEFANLTMEQRHAMDEAAKDKRDFPAYDMGDGGPKMDSREGAWRYRISERPDERDLRQARTFMEQIIEDHFVGLKEKRTPIRGYCCIS